MSDKKPETTDDLTTDEKELIDGLRETTTEHDKIAHAAEEVGSFGLPPRFLDRVRKRAGEEEGLALLDQQTKAFQEFFTLTAQINEAGQDLAIKKAVLDVEAGEVTVTYRTRPFEEEPVDETAPAPEAQAA